MAGEAALPAVIPAAELTRNKTLLVGSAFAAAASVMVFVGLFGIYISLRQNAEHLAETGRTPEFVWFPELAVQIAPGTMMLFTALMSALTMAWAVQAIRNDDRRNAYIALALTLLLGGAIINQAAFAISDFGLPVDRSVPALLLYALYGSFIVFLAIAMAFVFLMFVRTIAGQFNSRNADGIEAAAIYWYATVVVYPVLWYLISITK